MISFYCITSLESCSYFCPEEFQRELARCWKTRKCTTTWTWSASSVHKC